MSMVGILLSFEYHWRLNSFRFQATYTKIFLQFDDVFWFKTQASKKKFPPFCTLIHL
jgi:hypothetical protein